MIFHLSSTAIHILHRLSLSSRCFAPLWKNPSSIIHFVYLNVFSRSEGKGVGAHLLVADCGCTEKSTDAESLFRSTSPKTTPDHTGLEPELCDRHRLSPQVIYFYCMATSRCLDCYTPYQKQLIHAQLLR